MKLGTDKTMKKEQKSIFHTSGTRNFFYHSVIVKNISSNSKQLPSLDTLKKEYISYLLKITNNNKTKTARILNISIPGLYKKLEKYQVSH
jgi:DNA-binding NtrC family response regulator